MTSESSIHHYYITGSSSGIGKALAEECLNRGYTVTGISRSNTINHPNFTHLSLDLSDPSILSNFKFSNPNKSAQRIVLVNNAGMIEPVKPIGEMDNKTVVHNLTLNLIAPVVLSNSFNRDFKDLSSEKLIINISSGAAWHAVDGWGCYCASKAGLQMLTNVAAMERERRNDGSLMVAIAPGIINTDMQVKIRNANSDDFSRHSEFVDYYESGKLIDPALTAVKILDSVKNLNNIKDVVFSLQY